MNQTEKFWDKIANKFDKRAKHFEQPPIEKTKQYLNTNDIVLDYGCATGTITYEIVGSVNKIVGIDFSSKMIDAANGKSVEYKLENVEFVKSTIFDKRYNQGSFDVVLAFNILHLIENREKVLQRINELLKPGGMVISATACMGEYTFINFLQFLIFKPLAKLGIVPNLKIFKLYELESLMINENFKIIETKRINQSPNYFIVARKI